MLDFDLCYHHRIPSHTTTPFVPITELRCFNILQRNRKALFWPSPCWNSAILLTAPDMCIEASNTTTRCNSQKLISTLSYSQKCSLILVHPGSSQLKHHTWPTSRPVSMPHAPPGTRASFHPVAEPGGGSSLRAGNHSASPRMGLGWGLRA